MNYTIDGGLVNKSHHLKDKNFIFDPLSTFFYVPKSTIYYCLIGDEKLSFYFHIYGKVYAACYIIDFQKYYGLNIKNLNHLLNSNLFRVRDYAKILSSVMIFEINFCNKLSIERNIENVAKVTIISEINYAEILIKTIILNLKYKGFEAIIITITNPQIQEIILKLGGRCFKSLNYKKEFSLDLNGSVDIWYIIL